MQEACADYEKALVVDPSNSQAKELFNLAVQQFSVLSSLCFRTNKQTKQKKYRGS